MTSVATAAAVVIVGGICSRCCEPRSGSTARYVVDNKRRQIWSRTDEDYQCWQIPERDEEILYRKLSYGIIDTAERDVCFSYAARLCAALSWRPLTNDSYRDSVYVGDAGTATACEQCLGSMVHWAKTNRFSNIDYGWLSILRACTDIILCERSNDPSDLKMGKVVNEGYKDCQQENIRVCSRYWPRGWVFLTRTLKPARKLLIRTRLKPCNVQAITIQDQRLDNKFNYG